MRGGQGAVMSPMQQGVQRESIPTMISKRRVEGRDCMGTQVAITPRLMRVFLVVHGLPDNRVYESGHVSLAS